MTIKHSRSLMARLGVASVLCLSACATQSASSEAPPPALSWWIEDSTSRDVVTTATSVDAAGNVVIGVSRNTGVTEVARYDSSNGTTFDVTVALPHSGYVRSIFAASGGATYATIDGTALWEQLVKLDASGKVAWSVTPASGKSIRAVRELPNGDIAIIVQQIGGTSEPVAMHLSAGSGAKVSAVAIALPHATAFAIATDGSMAFAGDFTAPIAATGQSPAGNVDHYVASVDASGGITWAVSEGGDLHLVIEALAFLPDGSIAAGGEVFSGDLEGGQAFGTDLGGSAPFIAAFSGQGDVRWVTRTDAGSCRIDAESFSVGPNGIVVGLTPASTLDNNSLALVGFDGKLRWKMPLKMDILSVAAAPNGTYYAGGVVHGVLTKQVQGNQQGILTQWK